VSNADSWETAWLPTVGDCCPCLWWKRMWRRLECLWP